MQNDTLKRFLRVSRIWTILFLALFTGSYFLGFIPTGAKEAFLSFIRPSDSDSPILLSVPLQNANALASETWTAPRIIIPQIEVNSRIILSSSNNLDILNADLLKGVVHYPNSAMPGKTGNVVLFGHSTMLPAHNEAYKVFSNLKKLKEGDVIQIHSDITEYVYAVTGVEVTRADNTRTNLTSDRKILTLISCNVIGGEESRYVVEAEFLRSYPLGSMSSSLDTSSKI